MTVGKKIKLLRENKNLTRQELAEKIQVTDVTISRYENNKREPNIETLNKIAEALNVDLSELLAGNDDEINYDSPKKKSSLTKLLETVDRVQLKRDMEKTKATEKFFTALGYKLDHYQINEDGDIMFEINGVEYTHSQFEKLIKMMKSCIDDVNEILGTNQTNN